MGTDHCGRPDCMLCTSRMVEKKDKGRPATCGREAVVYRISCDDCAVRHVSAHYFGESARTGYLRGCEHASGRERALEENVLHKHDSIHHPGAPATYSMRIIRTHKTALSRQVHEASEIECSKAMITMNSRGEWNSQHIPRITIEDPGRAELHDHEAGIQQWESGVRAHARNRCREPWW